MTECALYSFLSLLASAPREPLGHSCRLRRRTRLSVASCASAARRQEGEGGARFAADEMRQVDIGALRVRHDRRRGRRAAQVRLTGRHALVLKERLKSQTTRLRVVRRVEFTLILSDSHGAAPNPKVSQTLSMSPCVVELWRCRKLSYVRQRCWRVTHLRNQTLLFRRWLHWSAAIKI